MSLAIALGCLAQEREKRRASESITRPWTKNFSQSRTYCRSWIICSNCRYVWHLACSVLYRVTNPLHLLRPLFHVYGQQTIYRVKRYTVIYTESRAGNHLIYLNVQANPDRDRGIGLAIAFLTFYWHRWHARHLHQPPPTLHRLLNATTRLEWTTPSVQAKGYYGGASDQK